MAYDFRSESEVKEFLHNIGIEYRFGCYSERKPEVCHLLGDFLESVKKDYDKAGKIYKTNCDEFSYGKSCLKYATYCLLAKGGVKEDYAEAYKYLDVASEQNEPDACFNQGLLLVTNNEERGVEMNIEKGVKLLERGCAGKNGNSCYYLSGMHISGIKKPSIDKKSKKVGDDQYMLKPDMKMAYKYAVEGCNLRNMYSCANLSQMYARGEGVEKDLDMAKKFKEIAIAIQNEVKSNQTLTFQQGLK